MDCRGRGAWGGSSEVGFLVGNVGSNQDFDAERERGGRETRKGSNFTVREGSLGFGCQSNVMS